jgi:hypothetical protein
MTKNQPPTSQSSDGSAAAHHQHHNGNGSAQLYRVFILIFACSVITFVVTTIFILEPTHDAHHLHEEGPKHALLKEFVSGGRERRQQKGQQQQIDQVSKSLPAAPMRRPFAKSTTRMAETKPNLVPVPFLSAKSSGHPHYHVVFSTSCTDQQHWESYVFFYHADKVQQPGDVTRIVSGCTDEEAQELQEFHNQHIATLSPLFYLHLTPDFSKRPRDDDVKDRKYKYMNKPYGLRHWMEQALFSDNATTTTTTTTTKTSTGSNRNREEVEHDIVILMDPDMILLRPIVHDYTHEKVIFVEHDNPHINKVVQHGQPMAQQDGYLGNQWMYLNQTYITNGKKLPDHVKTKDGPLHYNTGPPVRTNGRLVFHKLDYIVCCVVTH